MRAAVKVRSGWERVPFGDIVIETQYGTAQKANEEGRGLPILRMNNVTYSGCLNLDDLKHVELEPGEVEQYTTQRGDLLFNRTNSQDLVGKMAMWDRDERFAIAGYLVRIRVDPKRADPGFVSAWFNSPEMKALLRTRAKPSINMSNISASEVLKFSVPLPPLPEQRRIAEVLDRAEALRAKRRAALERLGELVDAFFVRLFGESTAATARWETTRFQDLLARPLRNGLSPSNVGSVAGHVLTLSAITGRAFDASALKACQFDRSPATDQFVNSDDLLICRGNGNVALVGKACFPTADLPAVAFPDTMIAARIDCDKIERHFLQYVWNSPTVRRQIESLARTTNGTFKVNQTMLESIQLPSPPLPLQQEFARRVAALEMLKAAHRASLAEMDALFASLQHRAFRGEL